MAAAETARLIASLELKDNKFGLGIDRAIGKIGKLEGSLGRIGAHAQRGVQNAITNIARLGIVAAAAVGGAIGIGVRSLADLARAEEQTAAVIESTGGKAGVSAGEVRKYAEELETLSTVDDKVIQDGENMLLTFTGIGKDIFPQATKAALNMAVAMASGNVEQVDLKASAIQLGKALNDPVKGITALRKVGVAFTKQQQDQIKSLVKSGDTLGAQKIILKELEVEFGKAAEAAGKGPEASLRRLQDVGEDLSQTIARGVLPVLERFAGFLSTKLSDPAVIATIDKFGQALGVAGGKALDFLETVDFGAIGAGLEVAAGAAGTIVSAFNSMPDWVKIAVVSGWGLNKLTGGALGSIAGEIGKGLFARGGSPASPLFVADVTGGLGKGLPGKAGGLSGVSKMFLVGEAIGLGLLVEGFRSDQAAQSTAHSEELQGTLAEFLRQKPTEAALKSALAGVEQGIRDIESNPLNVLVQGDALDNLREMRADIARQLANQGKGVAGKEVFGPPKPGQPTTGPLVFGPPKPGELEGVLKRALAAGFKPTDAAVQATYNRNLVRAAENQKAAIEAVKAQEGRTTAAALLTAAAVQNLDRQKPPSVSVTTNVNVTAAQVNKSVVVQRRAGPSGGSRERSGPLEF